VASAKVDFDEAEELELELDDDEEEREERWEVEATLESILRLLLKINCFIYGAFDVQYIKKPSSVF
jgi:hypothetical protein